jgi:hypothetical protein
MDSKFYRNPSEPGLNFIKIEGEFALAFFSYEGSIAFQKIEKPNLIFNKSEWQEVQKEDLAEELSFLQGIVSGI